MKTNEKETKQKVVPALRFPEFQNAGEWEQTTIGALCTICNGKSNVQDNVQNGKYPLFDRSEVIKTSNKFLFDCEAIIIPGEGRFTPKYYIGKFDLHQRAYALKDFTCHALFVYHYITAFSFILTQKAVKSTVLSLRMSILEAFPMLLPNIQEQQRIAECLSSVDDLITAQTDRLEALKNHKKGLIQQLFPAEGKTVPALRFPEFQNAGEWIKNPLFQIGEVLQGYGFPEKYQGKLSGKYPFYKVSDISKAVQTGSNFISVAANYIDDEELNILKIKTIPPGTTIFARIGEAIRLNRRIVTTQECIVDNNIVGVKAIPENAIDLFVYYILLQIDFIDFAGGVVPAVTKSAIENIPIYYPPTKSEQQKIVACLSSVDDLITAQMDRLEALKNHKKGLMQQLFPNVNDLTHE